MHLNYDIRQLKENEIAGADTVNPLVKFVLGMKSQSEWLTINPDGMGSVNFDLDAAGLLRAAQSLLQYGLKFDFMCSIENGRLSVAAGKVYLPASAVSISSHTYTLTLADAGKMVYVRLNSASAGEIVFGSAVTHTVQTGGGSYRVTFPIATISRGGGAWRVTYHHIGDIELACTPHVYISGYDKSKIQALMHDEGSDGLIWVEAGPCKSTEGA